ncbi:MAG: hypothetical protein IPJ41_00005 [Phycisphaerales bacterium]|nr:hypothetical protein [Phycisphaerales bacterium]
MIAPHLIPSPSQAPGVPPSGLAPRPFGDLALSPHDEQLLSALFAPGATRDSVAAAHDLSPTALALWLEQPEVQRAYQAMLNLDGHFSRLWQEQHYRTSIETLAEVQKTSDNLPERRRAASAVLRALARTTQIPRRPAAGVADLAKPGPAPVQSPLPTAGVAGEPARPEQRFPKPADAPLADSPDDPLSPRTLHLLDHPSHLEHIGVPEQWHEDPAILTERIADRLALAPNPDFDRIERLVRGALHLDVLRPGAARLYPLIDRILESPLLIPKLDPQWVRTLADVHHTSQTEAFRDITWRHSDSRERRCRIHLRYDDGLGGRFFPAQWGILDITIPETSNPNQAEPTRHGPDQPNQAADTS